MTTDLPGYGITDHLFLSDLRSGALVDPAANVAWMCFPNFDSPPIFHRILDQEHGGHFSISMDGMPPSKASYEGSSLSIKYEWPAATLHDLLECDNWRPYQRAGRTNYLRILSGSGQAKIRFSPRYDFGRIPLTLISGPDGIAVEGTPFRWCLQARNWTWTLKEEEGVQVAEGTKVLNDQAETIELCLGGQGKGRLVPADPSVRLQRNIDFWSQWLKSMNVSTVAPELVKQSALILRGLEYGPKGSFVAALTTSLPESIGGDRNWDYRYCWPRDAALTASALARFGIQAPGRRLVDWFLDILEDEGESFLKPLYTIKGHDVPAEAEISGVAGFAGSLPVRTGNLAAHQLQLDVLAPVAELLAILAKDESSATDEYFGLVKQMVDMVSNRWQDADNGIWEIRTQPRHYVHSKLMCWYTVHCAIDVARQLGFIHQDWVTVAQTIKSDIEEKGFCTKTQTYSCAYGYAEPDASLLWLVLTRFHDPCDPRLLRTTEWIIRHLVKDEYIYRYQFGDGLNGDEGAFLICQSWLIEVLCMQGRQKDAARYLDNYIAAAGPHGLFSEQYHPQKRIPLGNVPQAYSHLGLLNAVRAIGGSTVKEQMP